MQATALPNKIVKRVGHAGTRKAPSPSYSPATQEVNGHIPTADENHEKERCAQQIANCQYDTSEQRRKFLSEKIRSQHGTAANRIAGLEKHDHNDRVHYDLSHAVDGRVEDATADNVGDDEERQDERPSGCEYQQKFRQAIV